MGLIKKDKIDKYTVKREEDEIPLDSWWSYSAVSSDTWSSYQDVNVSAKPTKRVQVPKWYDGANQKGGRKRKRNY